MASTVFIGTQALGNAQSHTRSKGMGDPFTLYVASLETACAYPGIAQSGVTLGATALNSGTNVTCLEGYSRFMPGAVNSIAGNFSSFEDTCTKNWGLSIRDNGTYAFSTQAYSMFAKETGLDVVIRNSGLSSAEQATLLHASMIAYNDPDQSVAFVTPDADWFVLSEAWQKIKAWFSNLLIIPAVSYAY